MNANMVSLEKLLKRMDIPTHRKSGFNKNNLIWLQKHLPMNNVGRPKFVEAMAEINRRVEEKDYES